MKHCTSLTIWVLGTAGLMFGCGHNNHDDDVGGNHANEACFLSQRRRFPG